MKKEKIDFQYEWQMMKDIIKILERERVNVWLDHGTLLGFVRRGWFIPWDNDVDLAALARDVWKSKKVLKKKFEENNYDIIITYSKISIKPKKRKSLPIDVHLYWRKKYYLIYNSDSLGKKNIKKILIKKTFPGGIIRYPLKSRNIFHNIVLRVFFPILKILSPLFYKIKFIKNFSTLKIHESVRRPYKISIQTVLPIKKIKKIKDFSLPIPAKEEKYLENYYGEDWRTPKPDFNKLEVKTIGKRDLKPFLKTNSITQK